MFRSLNSFSRLPPVVASMKEVAALLAEAAGPSMVTYAIKEIDIRKTPAKDTSNVARLCGRGLLCCFLGGGVTGV